MTGSLHKQRIIAEGKSAMADPPGRASHHTRNVSPPSSDSQTSLSHPVRLILGSTDFCSPDFLPEVENLSSPRRNQLGSVVPNRKGRAGEIQYYCAELAITKGDPVCVWYVSG